MKFHENWFRRSRDYTYRKTNRRMDERTKGRMDRPKDVREKDKHGETHTRFFGLCELAKT